MTYFAIADLRHSKDDLVAKTFQVTGVGCPLISPYVFVQRLDVVRDFGSPKNHSYFTKLGFSASQKLPGLKYGANKVSLDFDTSFGSSQGFFEKPADPVFLQEIMSSTFLLGYKGKMKFSLTPSVRLIEPLHHQDGEHAFIRDGKRQWIGGLNFGLSF